MISSHQLIYHSITSEVISYSTTVCPVTQTTTLNGEVITITTTTTSVIPVHIQTTLEATVTLAPATS